MRSIASSTSARGRLVFIRSKCFARQSISRQAESAWACRREFPGLHGDAHSPPVGDERKPPADRGFGAVLRTTPAPTATDHGRPLRGRKTQPAPVSAPHPAPVNEEPQPALPERIANPQPAKALQPAPVNEPQPAQTGRTAPSRTRTHRILPARIAARARERTAARVTRTRRSPCSRTHRTHRTPPILASRTDAAWEGTSRCPGAARGVPCTARCAGGCSPAEGGRVDEKKY